MKRLHQKENYTCWGTAIACILDDPDDFPHEKPGLTLKEAEENWGKHHSDVVNYLNARGFCLINLRLLSNTHMLRGYHLISGISPRGFLHTVVGECGKIVHDPWPGDDKGLTDQEPWEFELFMAHFMPR